MRKALLVVLSTASVVAACGGAESPMPILPSAPASARPAGIDPEAMDEQVKPCEDFYRFACGRWLANTPIPDDQGWWMRSFIQLAEENEKVLREILERDAQSPPANEAYAKQLGDYYASCMDEQRLESAGHEALTRMLAKIDTVKNAASFAAVLGEMHATGQPALFDFASEIDANDATQVIGVFSQRGLGLPDRDYYVKTDAKSQTLRDTYEAHVSEMLRLAGDTPEAAKAGAKTVLALETALAKVSMTAVERREPRKLYHRVELAGLKKIAPEFAWDTYLAAVGAAGVTAINVQQPEFIKAVGGIAKGLRGKALADWKTYLRWHTLHGNAAALPVRFVDQDFRLRHALYGTPKLPPRWKRCVRTLDHDMGEALAQPFVEQRLGANGKALAIDVLGDLKGAMKSNLGSISWMDEPTRGRGLEKLGAIRDHIAYPKAWRTYDGLEIQRGAYLENTLRASAFEVRRQLAKIGKPVDREEWFTSPTTVDAFYDGTKNEVVFPAGILAYPFFSPRATASLNYGSVGAVMGHEITHGFDDEGRQYDSHGNLKDWWTPSVSSEFDRRAACVVSQFDEYVAIDDVHVNGKLTLGENIADLGGVKIAYAAFQAAMKTKEPSTASYTPEQEFFIAFGQTWCSSMRNEMARARTVTDQHAPPRFRVNGPLSNMPEFAKAFRCSEGSPMVRPANKRCEVW